MKLRFKNSTDLLLQTGSHIALLQQICLFVTFTKYSLKIKNLIYTIKTSTGGTRSAGRGLRTPGLI
jgi:hypothetical protein